MASTTTRGRSATSTATAARTRARNSYLLKKYGITQEQYDDLLHRQGEHCAICTATATHTGNGKLRNKAVALAVDHDHATGEIRGLLCWSCNRRLLGRYRRADANLFRNAAVYLEGGTGLYVPVKKKIRKRRRRK